MGTLLAADASEFEQRLTALIPFAISLALGALIGIERQRVEALEPRSLSGGIRTFPLIGLLGCSAAWLGAQFGVGAFLVVAGAFALLLVAVYVVTSWNGDIGMTTEVAALLTFVYGAMVYHGHALLASALAVVTTVLLSLREPLHAWARRIKQEDLFAALKLAVVTVIVLPLLPDQNYGPEPYQIYNPFRMWLLVVFIAAVGFAGYVGVQMLGAGRGIAAAGLLGGIVSSTAVTLSFSGRSREHPELSPMFALAIALSWVMMCARVLIEVAVANPALLGSVAWPVGAAMLAAVAGSGVLYFRTRQPGQTPEVPYRNPFSLRSAFKFGLLFVAILSLAKFAQVWFREAGVLVAAALTGTVDVDAMTLSSAQLALTGELDAAIATRAICVTLASNTAVKAGMAFVLGTPELRRILWPIGAAMIAAGAVALVLLM